MKNKLILFGALCLLTLTGSTLSTTESRSQNTRAGIGSPRSETLYKKDSILSMIQKKDDAIDMKMNKLERQLYLLKKENRKMNRLLRIKNKELTVLQDRLVQLQADRTIDSNEFIPINKDAVSQDGKTNFVKKLINKLKNKN